MNIFFEGLNILISTIRIRIETNAHSQHCFKTVDLTSLSLVGRPFLVRAPPVKAL
jgi:hypothetical protein